MIVPLLFLIMGWFTLASCVALLSPSDWGQPVSTTGLDRLAVVAMQSPRLNEPIEGELVPTAYLAQIVADHLKERVEVVDTSRAGAGTDEAWEGFGGWMTMEGYLGRARAWYMESRSQIDYSELASRGIDGVIEIGLLNYEIPSESLIMQVIIKVINPVTGVVLGKARAAAYEKIEPFTPLQFKLTFALAAKTLTVDNLERVGLTTPNTPAPESRTSRRAKGFGLHDSNKFWVTVFKGWQNMPDWRKQLSSQQNLDF